MAEIVVPKHPKSYVYPTPVVQTSAFRAAEERSALLGCWTHVNVAAWRVNGAAGRQAGATDEERHSGVEFVEMALAKAQSQMAEMESTASTAAKSVSEQPKPASARAEAR